MTWLGTTRYRGNMADFSSPWFPCSRFQAGALPLCAFGPTLGAGIQRHVIKYVMMSFLTASEQDCKPDWSGVLDWAPGVECIDANTLGVAMPSILGFGQSHTLIPRRVRFVPQPTVVSDPDEIFADVLKSSMTVAEAHWHVVLFEQDSLKSEHY
jgi:hypothetical protein